MAANWPEIEREYLTTETSYRRLAEKYGVDQATIARRAKKDDWVSKRQRHADETQAKMLAEDTKRVIDRSAALHNAADLLLRKIVAGIKAYESLPATAAKNYSDALKNLREIHAIRTEEDLEEQRARIAKLRRDAERSDRDGRITVVLGGGVDGYGD